MWAVPLMCPIYADWQAIGDQTPLLKRKPSEYFRDHIRVRSQPMHEPPLT